MIDLCRHCFHAGSVWHNELSAPLVTATVNIAIAMFIDGVVSSEARVLGAKQLPHLKNESWTALRVLRFCV